MRVELLLPALTEAKSPFFRPVKYALFPPLGGLHVTALPNEAARHADAIVLGPAGEAWPRFLEDFRAGRPQRAYRSRARTLAGMPPVRRDLIRRELYLVPNSIVVSRGCPHACGFCYKDGFFAGGRSFECEPVWDLLIRARRVGRARPFLERVLDEAQGRGDAAAAGAIASPQRAQFLQPGSVG